MSRPDRETPAGERPGAKLTVLLASWDLSLADRQLSDRYREICARTGKAFTAWLAANGIADDTEAITSAHIRAFLSAEADRTSAISAHQHFRNLRVLFRWLAKEGERASPDPMIRVDPPKLTRKVKDVLSERELADLIRACEGQGFEARRDTAIIRIFIDTGVRVGGIANIMTSDVQLAAKRIRVVLKGGDEHLIPIGRKATAALDRYLRTRARHRHADSAWLWLGTAGRDPGHFGTAGIQDMLGRRGSQAGIPRLTPHYFRRTFAHDWLAAGGSELDAMRIAGWKTRTMVEMYAGDLAADRARAAHERLAPGDRI